MTTAADHRSTRRCVHRCQPRRIHRRPTFGVLAYVVLFRGRGHPRPDAVRDLGGFKTNGQLAANPVGLLPDPWVFYELHRLASAIAAFWRSSSTASSSRPSRSAVVVLRRARRVRLRARSQFPGREALYTLFMLGLLFPAAVAILPLFILVRELGCSSNPLGVALPAGGVRAAADDRDPAAVLPEHPGRARGRGARSTAAARSGSSGGSSCRCRGRPSPRSACSRIVSSWNAFLLPLVLLNDANQWTLPLGVMNFSTQYTLGHGAHPRVHRRSRSSRPSSSTSSPSATSSAA